MIGVLAASSLAISLASNPPVPTSVPAQFQGEWRVKREACPPAITDRPIWISERQIRIDHSIGEVRLIRQDGPRKVTLAGELLSDGDPWNAELQLTLSETDDELTMSEGNWTVALKRCPAEKYSPNGAAAQ